MSDSPSTQAASPGGAPAPWLDPGLARRIAFVLLCLATLPLLTKNFTSDFGTHIAMGRQIVSTHSLPTKEFLNYTSLGMPNFNHEWGFQALLYIVFSVGGLYAVSFLCWAVVFGIFLLLHRATVLRGGHPLLSVLGIAAFSGFLRIRIQPRPEIFTYLFVAAAVYMLSEYYFGKRKKLLYLFPAFMVVWANVHGSYLIAFILSGAFFVDALARALWNGEFRWERLRAWVGLPIVVAFLGLLLCGLNPLGYDALLAPLHLISRGSGKSQILMSISELTPVRGTGMFVYFKAAAVFAAVSLALGAVGRRLYLLDVMLFAVAFKGSWESARAVSMFGLFLSPGVSIHLTGFLDRAWEWLAPARRAVQPPAASAQESGRKKKGSKERDPRPPKVPVAEPRLSPLRVAIPAATVAGILAFGVVTTSYSMSQLEFGVGLTEHKFSMGAAEFLRKNPIKGNMFNFFDIGGFLDWQLYPQALTFIDGRAINQQVFIDHQAITAAAPNWRDVMARYGITYVVSKSMDSSGMILPIIPALGESPDWSLVFADGLFVVFAKNLPENEPLIRKFAIPKALIPQQVIWEAYHYMYLGVSPIASYATMSNMYQIMGNTPASIESLRKALSYGEDPYLRARLVQLERAAGTR